ncbi:MAG: hypothetical protein Kow00124_05880 [Anaerolineae bacterium]
MATKRQQRVAQELLEVLSTLIQFEVSDPRLADVSVLDVEIDRELRYATVYVHALGGPDVRDQVMEGLHSATGYLRRELGARIRLQFVPELRFKWDDTPERAEAIDRLLESLDIPAPADETEQPDELD